MKITIILATNCMKMYWKGFGTAIQMSRTVNTWMVKESPGLKKVTITMVSITTGITMIKEG